MVPDQQCVLESNYGHITKSNTSSIMKFNNLHTPSRVPNFRFGAYFSFAGGPASNSLSLGMLCASFEQ